MKKIKNAVTYASFALVVFQLGAVVRYFAHEARIAIRDRKK